MRTLLIAAAGLALAACGDSQKAQTRAQEVSPRGTEPATVADGTGDMTTNGSAPAGDSAVPPGATGSTGTGATEPGAQESTQQRQ